MNMKQFQYVLTLARAGSFSRAAEELRISQPSLSQYIRKIEKEQGVELFRRASNRLFLTDAGRIYIEAGRRILELEKEMQKQFDDLRSEESGSVVLGISAHRSVCLMPAVVRRFRESYPGIRLVLDERPRDDLLEAAEHGEFDLCLTTLPISEELFLCETVMREEVLLAVPVGSELERRLGEADLPVSPSGLPTADLRMADGCDFLFLKSGHPMQKILEDQIRRYGLALRDRMECSSLEAVMAMADVGAGAALIPSCLRTSSRGGTRFFSLSPSVPYRDIVLIHRKDHYLSRPAQTLSDLLVQLSRSDAFS